MFPWHYSNTSMSAITSVRWGNENSAGAGVEADPGDWVQGSDNLWEGRGQGEALSHRNPEPTNVLSLGFSSQHCVSVNQSLTRQVKGIEVSRTKLVWIFSPLCFPLVLQRFISAFSVLFFGGNFLDLDLTTGRIRFPSSWIFNTFLLTLTDSLLSGAKKHIA